MVVRQRVTARLRKLGHTLAKGMWEGYVQEAPEFVGLFPSRLVEQVWMPYGVVHELMMSAPELPQPIIQQGGESKKTASPVGFTVRTRLQLSRAMNCRLCRRGSALVLQ